MPPKKRAKPNGFSCFASEIMNNSLDNLSFCQALARANPIWHEMDENERKPYHLMAKNQEPREIKSREKKNSEGIELSVVQADAAEKLEKIREMKRSIQQIVKQSKQENEFETKKYFFIAVNYFVRTGEIYVPAEISIAEFSLQDGVSRKYSTYINPAVDIFGHRLDAIEHATNTHRLPIPPKAMGEKNLTVINKHIIEFIKNNVANDATESVIPVYTHKDSIEIVKSALKFLSIDNGDNNFELPVYSIHYLLFIMKEIACEIGELPIIKTQFESDAFFECDEFEYQIGISCDYHENMDRGKYCTQAIVTRWGFMFAKYMCNDIAIAMLPGRHFPKKVNVIASISKECKFEKLPKIKN